MIYDAAIFPDDAGRSIVRTPRSISEYVGRIVAGSFLLGVGALVLYTFLSGGGPFPTGSGVKLVIGWLILALSISALGFLPFYLGFTTLFVTGSFCICSAQRLVESRLAVCGFNIWVRSYPFRVFDRITIRHSRSGFPVSCDRFLVSAEGSSHRIRLSTSTDAAASKHLASAIATELDVPVETT